MGAGSIVWMKTLDPFGVDLAAGSWKMCTSQERWMFSWENAFLRRGRPCCLLLPAFPPTEFSSHSTSMWQVETTAINCPLPDARTRSGTPHKNFPTAKNRYRPTRWRAITRTLASSCVPPVFLQDGFSATLHMHRCKSFVEWVLLNVQAPRGLSYQPTTALVAPTRPTGTTRDAHQNQNNGPHPTISHLDSWRRTDV